MELYDKLKEYAASDFYPWHMPGHKRRLIDFENPFSIDITEISGFDDLHHPEGILKDAMEEAAAIYGAEKTCFLVNGSSCGILAAISAAVKPGEKLLLARNCHKSAYHAALLMQAEVTYVYPPLEKEGFYGALQVEAVEEALRENPGIRALILVSPGYEGIVSDVEAIAEAAHRYGCAVLVDEAHGAHLPFAPESVSENDENCEGVSFPESALNKGADIVIQSLHKTLPSLTQTALLHVGKGGSKWINMEMLEFYLRVYQSSSPSYVFMAGIDHCIRLMAGDTGKQLMENYARNLRKTRQYLKEHLRVLRLYEPASGGQYASLAGNRTDRSGKNSQEEAGKCFYDPSKFVLVLPDCEGSWLADKLRSHYHLEPEMNTERYVILMSSPADEEEGFQRLCSALVEIDNSMEKSRPLQNGSNTEFQKNLWHNLPEKAPAAAMTSMNASNASGQWVPFEEAVGKVCHDFIYIYPPGIPLLVPGEVIEEEHLALINTWQSHGLEVHGVKAGDSSGCYFIRIVI